MKRIRITIALTSFFLQGCSNVSFNLQNDVFTGTDGNFTNGAGLNYSGSPEKFPAAMQKVFELIPVPTDLDPNQTSSRYLIGLRQDMYTPDNIKDEEIIKNENPYAGTLTLNLKKLIMTTTSKTSTTIRVGSSGGPSLAAQTQIGVHGALSSIGRLNERPNGWDNQIATEPIVNIDHEQTWEDLRLNRGSLGFALQGTELARLGNIQTDGTLAYGARAGYNLPTLNNLLRDRLSLFVFSTPYVSARLRNIYYDGGIFTESPHTVDKEPFIGGLESGFGAQYNNYELRFIYNMRTRDYKEQEDPVRGFGFLSFGVDW